MKHFEGPAKRLSEKQRVGWLLACYGLFLLGFFTLGFFSENKGVALVNFALDAVLCVVSLVLSVGFLSSRYKTPLAGRLGLLFVSLCLTAFTIFGFLLPENGITPVLFR